MKKWRKILARTIGYIGIALATGVFIIVIIALYQAVKDNFLQTLILPIIFLTAILLIFESIAEWVSKNWNGGA